MTKASANIERSTPLIEAKFEPGDVPGEIEGYAATFNDAPDSYGDVIAPGAFTESLAQHKASGEFVPMLWTHDMARPVGHWHQLAEDDQGLKVKGKLNLETAAGREAHSHLKNKDITGLSIGYRVPEGGRSKEAKGISTLHKISLHEISLVALPSNRSARIRQVKNGPLVLSSSRELEDLLMSSGLPRAAARKLAAGGWPNLVSGDHSETSSDELVSAIKRIKDSTSELKGLMK